MRARRAGSSALPAARFYGVPVSQTDHELGAPAASGDEDDLRFDADDDADEQSDLFADDVDDGDVPTVSLEPRERAASGWSLRWVVGAFAVLVVAGLTIGIVVFNSAAPDNPRGRVTPQETTRAFLTAINRGDEKAAARLSCDKFGADARSAARSGADPGISFSLVPPVTRSDTTHATAQFAQRMKVGGSVQRTPYKILLHRASTGRWLVCARG